MSEQVDLNRLRETLLRNQREGAGEKPTDPSRRVFVDPNGKVVVGASDNEATARTLSEVPQSIFARGL